MPRNEFKGDILEGLTPDEVTQVLVDGKCTVNDVRAHYGLPPAEDHPGKGEDEDPSQEVLPVTEEDPHMWPRQFLRPSLAALRRERGLTTDAHLAEMKSRDPSLFD